MGLGHQTKAQIFMEADSAWGTRVITTGSTLEADDISVDLEIGVIESRAFYSGLSARALYQMGINGAGTIAGECRYEGMAKLMAALMGKRGVFTLTNVAVQTAIYHIDKTAQFGTPSLSMELDEAGVYDTGGDCALVLGLVIPRAKFTINAGQGEDAMLRYEFDVLAKDKLPQTSTQFTAGVPAASQTPIFFNESDDTSFKDGTADAVAGVNVTGIDIEVINPLAKRFLLAPNAGSKNMKAPIRNGRVQVFWTVRKEFTSYSAFKAAKAFTDGELALKLVSPTNIPTSSPATPYSMIFNTKKAKALPGNATPRLNEWGILEHSVRWQAYHDPTLVGGVANGPLVVTLAQSKASEDTLGA